MGILSSHPLSHGSEVKQLCTLERKSLEIEAKNCCFWAIYVLRFTVRCSYTFWYFHPYILQHLVFLFSRHIMWYTCGVPVLNLEKCVVQ